MVKNNKTHNFLGMIGDKKPWEGGMGKWQLL